MGYKKFFTLFVCITLLMLAVMSCANAFDIVPWTKYHGNPVVTKGAPGSWDVSEAGHPTVLFIGGIYRMWYHGRNPSGQLAIGYATSSDGIGWTKFVGNPVLTVSPAPSWEGAHVLSPGVLFDGSTFHMWYTGIPDTGYSPTPYWDYAIGYASSPDGVTWTKYAGNPILMKGSAGAWDDRRVSSPSVIKVGATYMMYYYGDGSTTGLRQIGLATSTDGITWMKYTGNPILTPEGGWEGTKVSTPRVLYDGSTFHMWYYGADSSGILRVGYATSSDGYSWTKYSGNPLLEPTEPWEGNSIGSPSVVFNGIEYLGWYQGGSVGGTNEIGLLRGPKPPPVGGVWVPINKFESPTPWIGLASSITVAAMLASLVYVKRVKRKRN